MVPINCSSVKFLVPHLGGVSIKVLKVWSILNQVAGATHLGGAANTFLEEINIAILIQQTSIAMVDSVTIPNAHFVKGEEQSVVMCKHKCHTK